MRLQHGRNWALYRGQLQAAISMQILFGFRKATQNLGLAASGSTATGTANAISVGNGWDDEGVQKKDSCSKYEQDTFHDWFSPC